MTKWVALLRGVNVDSNRSLRMSDLAEFFKNFGFGDVRTLLASGNVVFSDAEKDASALEAMLEREATARLDLATDFLLRTVEEVTRIVDYNPFPEAAQRRPDKLLVAFGRSAVPADLPERLADIYDGPERLAVAGREMYIDFPEGQGRSKLWPAVARLGHSGTGTGRNWNTVVKIRQALLGLP
jgi:uncharacterized protein (DUF1697 family)